MNAFFSCPQGHRWQATLGDPSEAEALACPLCGALANPGATMPPTQLSATIAHPPPSTVPPRASHPHIPGYEILSVLGRGGNGVVYQAREERLHRVVALKLLVDHGHSSPQQLMRFQIEAEALASLQHPNVVQIYEVGEHELCPFLALEYVEGGTLAHWLNNRLLPPLEAAHLMETLARAMHALHQRGIVHRDLKPSNVLMTRDGVPKITDFGIAKRLDQETPATQTGSILGTPHYMAPEQARGEKQVGPPADVHSLGAILYEMLTGRPPYDGDSLMQVLEQVQSREPISLTRCVPGTPIDLDTIALKCLQKDPAKRYPDASALAEDLGRFQRGEPILARPVGPWERLAKWVRRRPTAAALTLVSVLAVVGVITGLLVHTHRLEVERERADQSHRVALRSLSELLGEVAEEQPAYDQRMQDRRQETLRRARDLCHELLSARQDDPLTRKYLAVVFLRSADIHRELMEHKIALRQYNQAITDLEKLVGEGEGTTTNRRHLAYAHNFRGWTLTLLSRGEEAQQAYESARDVLRVMQKAEDSQALRRDLARVHYNLGLLFRERGDRVRARLELREAIALSEELHREFPDNLDYQHHLARGQMNLAVVQLDAAAYLESRGSCDEAIARFERLLQRYPYRPDYSHELAIALTTRSNAQVKLAARELAEADLRRAIGLLEGLTKVLPRQPEYRYELANACNSLANVVIARNRSEARVALEHARDLYQGLSDEFRGVPRYQAELGMTLGSLGYLRLRQAEDLARLSSVLPFGLAMKPECDRLRGEARTDLEQGIAQLEAYLNNHAQHPDYVAALQFHKKTLSRMLAARQH